MTAERHRRGFNFLDINVDHANCLGGIDEHINSFASVSRGDALHVLDFNEGATE
jgi:hypothetical protein